MEVIFFFLTCAQNKNKKAVMRARPRHARGWRRLAGPRATTRGGSLRDPGLRALCACAAREPGQRRTRRGESPALGGFLSPGRTAWERSVPASHTRGTSGGQKNRRQDTPRAPMSARAPTAVCTFGQTTQEVALSLRVLPASPKQSSPLGQGFTFLKPKGPIFFISEGRIMVSEPRRDEPRWPMGAVWLVLRGTQ